ncbi:MAG TPA: CDP-alcohol phosphatidyltransferase family protein [Streptosporangiaceae bacterium]|jgi:CDP-diacylglycerol--glycerol-3-phosphate 3-phosphatidyltransferase
MLKLLRPALSHVLTPIGRGLARAGVTPNTITVIGTLGVMGGALAFYPRGELFWGTIVCTIFVLFDMLDGAVARVTGGGTTWGAFLDSTLDRVADAAIFSGVILWLAGGGGDLPLAGLALFCLVSGALVSYAKARAEGLGLKCDVGIAERGERILVGLVAIGLDGLGVPYALAVGLWLLAAASAVTVVQRIAVVRRQTVPAKGA